MTDKSSQEYMLEALKSRAEVREAIINSPCMEKLAEESINGSMEIYPGIFAEASSDLIRAWKEFARLRAEGALVQNDRQKEFEQEKKVMGNFILPVGLEIFSEKDKTYGRIILITRVDIPVFGIFDYPLYKVHLKCGDEYKFIGDCPDEKDCVLLYARHFRDFGLPREKV